MAFNNGFPMTYQQMYQPQYQFSQPQRQNDSNILWIQGGLQTAKSYLTAPNTTVALWDAEEQRIYIKTTDASGMPSIKTIEYAMVEDNKVTAKSAEEYAKKSDLDDLREKIDHLYNELEGSK